MNVLCRQTVVRASMPIALIDHLRAIIEMQSYRAWIREVSRDTGPSPATKQ